MSSVFPAKKQEKSSMAILTCEISQPSQEINSKEC